MTEEEIRYLQEGDTFLLKLTYETFDCQMRSPFYARTPSGELCCLSQKDMMAASLVKMSTKIEAGDRVRVIADPFVGTAYNDTYTLGNLIGKEFIVVTGCDYYGQIEVNVDNEYTPINIHCVELVEKKNEPNYHVVDAHTEWCVVDSQHRTISVFNKSLHPNAKAAAVTECNSLIRKDFEKGFKEKLTEIFGEKKFICSNIAENTLYIQEGNVLKESNVNISFVPDLGIKVENADMSITVGYEDILKIVCNDNRIILFNIEKPDIAIELENLKKTEKHYYEN